MTLLERFLKYVSYETTATEERPDKASNDKIYELSKEMYEELKALNPDEISMNGFGVVDAKFKGDDSKPAIAFLAHMDTSNQASGKDVKPQIIKDYDGSDIRLNDELTLSPSQFPTLLHAKGHTLITTSGDTLLGGDDKAGIAIIMTALNDILSKNEKHRSLEIIFTTDEEIGADAHHISMDKVNSKYGYTIDGGDYRYLAIESFTAYAMNVSVKGQSIHPGSAKDKLVNASEVLMEFHHALPEYLKPEDTSDKEPFYHLCGMNGTEDAASGEYIIRSFDEEQMKTMISLAKFTAKRMNEKLGYEAIILDIHEQYHNMKVVMNKYPQIKEEMEAVYTKLGIPFEYEAIRGGTTGSQLSFMGLPCPNLGTGDYNMHGRYEYVDYDEMETMVDVVKLLMKA
jgi:tripeptide aminopeptidase